MSEQQAPVRFPTLEQVERALPTGSHAYFVAIEAHAAAAAIDVKGPSSFRQKAVILSNAIEIIATADDEGLMDPPLTPELSELVNAANTRPYGSGSQFEYRTYYGPEESVEKAKVGQSILAAVIAHGMRRLNG